MTTPEKIKRGHGRIAVIERREAIEAMLKRGYRASEIYRKLQDELGITQSVFHKHLATLGITNKQKGIASSDSPKDEKAVDKTDEKPRRLTTKEKLEQGLLDSSDKPSFVHNRIPKPEELL